MERSPEQFLRFLRRLKSVREYTTEPVSDEMIQDILDVGRWTASGGNRQPWHVLVIRDPEVKKKLGDWGARPAATAAVVFLIVMQSEGPSLDEGRIAERLCLGAAAHGLGSVVATLKNEGPDEVKKLLGIPADRRAVALVAVGHVDREARKARPKNPQPRKPMEEFAKFDRF